MTGLPCALALQTLPRGQHRNKRLARNGSRRSATGYWGPGVPGDLTEENRGLTTHALTPHRALDKGADFLEDEVPAEDQSVRV